MKVLVDWQKCLMGRDFLPLDMVSKYGTNILDQIIENLPQNIRSDDLLCLRISSRARRLIFKSSLMTGVEIVIPNGASRNWVIEVVKKRIQWIRESQASIRKRRTELNPKEINLKSIEENWQIFQFTSDNLRNGFSIIGEYKLLIGFDSEDFFSVARNLQSWLNQKAEDFLIPWVDSLAEQRNLQFNRVNIKNQKTRWGSCSEKGNINLNRNLLLLPKHIVEYVIHHELTHLQHLDHSEEFWTTLTNALPECGKFRNELKSINEFDIPAWACLRTNQI